MTQEGEVRGKMPITDGEGTEIDSFDQDDDAHEYTSYLRKRRAMAKLSETATVPDEAFVP